MRLKFASLLLVSLLIASTVPTSFGYSNGVYNRGSSGCGCHGYNVVTVSMSGQPASYNPGTTYTLQISVSGNGNGGFSLDANKGTLSTGGVGIMAVKVNSAGNSATHTTNSYRSWSVDWTAPSAGSGSVQFDISAVSANGNGGTGGDTWGDTTITVPEGGAPPPTNNAPTVSNLQLSPSNPVTTDTLTLTYNYQDSDNDPESGTQIRWYKDGQLISSRNDQMTVPSSMTAKGESWNVTVTPNDGTD